MFWRVAGFSQPSPIEGILDKDDFTLEELLDEDDLIQEVKSLNNRLLDFLQRRDVVEKLVRYLIESPGDSDDPKRQFKYPYASCEIFACEVDGVFATLLDDEELMGCLFGFLDTDQPLNTSLAGYFGRVISSLLMRRTADLMCYLKGHQEVLELLVRHLQTTSVAEIVVHLVGSDEQSFMYYGTHHMYWLADTQLMQLLIERLAPEYPPETQTNAADILAAIAHTQPSPLASKLSSAEYMQMLFKRALVPECANVLVPTLNVCIALLEPKRVSTEGASQESGNAGASSDGTLKATAVMSILNQIPRLIDLLKQEDPGPGVPAVLKTTFGELKPPLGSRRWKIVELLSVLASAHGVGVDKALIEAGALEICLQLFTQYPFNNLLHHGVTSLIKACMEGTARMRTHLLKTCGLVTWLANAPPAIAATNNAKPVRAGYMGHITLLGNNLVSLSARNAEVRKMLANDEQWALFVTTTLQERNEIENVAKWTCGRPTTMGTGPDSDNDDFQNDVDLDTMGSKTVKSHDVFNRYDDDEDEDEDPEDSPSSFDRFDEANDAMGLLDIADDVDRELPDSWEDVADGNTSDEDAANAVVPVENHATDASALRSSMENDDGVLVITSDDEDSIAADLIVGAGGASPGVEVAVNGNQSPHAFSPTEWSSPSSPSPKGQATHVIEETEPQFNSFQFWKTEMTVDIPDDI